MSAHGTLYLLPVWLGDHGGPETMPAWNAAVAAGIRLFFAEHERTARAMLRRLVPDIELPKLEIHRCDKDTGTSEAARLLNLMRGGRNAAIVSEAGMPGIADPGAVLVRTAHALDIKVVPLPGPSSLILALASSGLNGQHFTFHGYLPRTPRDRQQALRSLETDVRCTGGAQLFIEAPYRNDALLADVLRTCEPGTLLCIATDLTQPTERVHTAPVREWTLKMPDLKDRPTVFILGKEA
ncbi:MAG: SAM-dependent methyltransferase [Flavobacteriales bacterium]|nr:MAG: SAM-dependent methyltransferase [Flavobacteriales bacterium]